MYISVKTLLSSNLSFKSPYFPCISKLLEVFAVVAGMLHPGMFSRGLYVMNILMLGSSADLAWSHSSICSHLGS